MTALERVLAEEWPDGTFGGPRPATPRYVPRTSRLSAARHRADLIAALRQAASTGQAWDQPIPARRTRKADR